MNTYSRVELSSLRKTIDREKSDIRSHLIKKLRESTSEHESKWSSAITAAKKAIAKDRDASRDADLAELHTKTKKECTERIEKALAQAKHDCTEHQSKLRESVEQASKALLDKTARELVKKRDDSRAKVLAEMSTRLEKHCNESLTAAAAKIRTEATAIVAKGDDQNDRRDLEACRHRVVQFAQERGRSAAKGTEDAAH